MTLALTDETKQALERTTRSLSPERLRDLARSTRENGTDLAFEAANSFAEAAFYDHLAERKEAEYAGPG